MEVEVDNICLCGSPRRAPQQFPAFRNGRRYSSCSNCGMGCLLPIIRETAALSDIYQRPEYMEYLSDAEAEGLAGFFLNVIQTLGFADQATPILDFGAGRCAFQHFFQKKGWNAIDSVEPNAGSRRSARERYGLNDRVYESITPAMLGKYKVILANMVMEHLENPVMTICETIIPALQDDGVVIFTVPNNQSLNRLVCGRFWIGYSSDEHNWFFGPRSAEVFLAKTGLSPLRISGKGLLFTEYDQWSPPGLVKPLYKHTVMRVAEWLSRGDQLLIIAQKSISRP